MIRQREFFTRHRHHIALLAVFGALLIAVMAHHSALEHGGKMDGMGTVMSICLAVMDAALVVGIAVGTRAFSLQRFGSPPRELGVLAETLSLAPAVRLPQPRAGPTALQVFRR